jgi:hypothetical protein
VAKKIEGFKIYWLLIFPFLDGGNNRGGVFF